MKEYIVQSKSGMYTRLSEGDSLRVIDVEGQQVADFFAVHEKDPNEILSPAVTIDCNGSLSVTIGDALYTNLYNEMFRIAEDTVGSHDLLHPCCRGEMYDFFYHNGANHPNCLENINTQMIEMGLPPHSIITPFNIFMNTQVGENGKIEVKTPKSKPNDYIEILALMDAHVFIAACSVSESDCNGGRCTPIRVIVT